MSDGKVIQSHKTPKLELCTVANGSFIGWLTFLLEHIAVKQLSVFGKAAPYFVVYSCVTSSFACVTKSAYFPILHVFAYDLRVACQDVEGDLRLRNV